MHWVAYRWRTQRNAIFIANCRIPRVYRSLNATGTERHSFQYVCFCVFVDFKHLNASWSAPALLSWKTNASQVPLLESKLDIPTKWSLFHKAISLDKGMIKELLGNPKAAYLCWRFNFKKNIFIQAPEIKQDHPLNLSISISGGKENNYDYLSRGDRTGKSSKLKSAGLPAEL